MANYRSELRIPVNHESKIHLDSSRDQTGSEYSTYSSRSGDWSKLDSGDRNLFDLDSKFVPLHKRINSLSATPMGYADEDSWYDDVKRRFDEQRRRWDEDVKRMHHDFFSPPLRSRIGTILPHSKSSTGTEILSGNFERAADGTVQFVSHFDVPEYEPETVKVSVKDGQLFVTARMERRASGSTTCREYSRSVNLPPGAEEDKITATLSLDGVLVVTCPMRPPPFSSNTSIYGTSEILSPSMETTYSSVSPSDLSYPRSEKSYTSSLKPYLKGGTNLNMSQSSHSDYGSTTRSAQRKPKFRLELPIDGDYLPGEINIKTLNRRIYVNARHEERAPNRTAVREFSKEYDIPDNIEPESLEAKLDHGTLYIEAFPTETITKID